MRATVAVLILTFVSVNCMPSLIIEGQDLTQGLDTSIPVGLNGQDKVKVGLALDKEKGLTLIKKQKTHRDNNSEEETNEGRAYEYTDFLKRRVQNAVNRYLDYDEKRLILKSDKFPARNIGITEDPKLTSKLRQDYLLAIAKKIHDTKIIKTPDGNAIVASAQHTAESQLPNYDSYVSPEYKTLAQKFGPSLVSSHYANAEFIQQKYANAPTFFGSKYGKLGSENTVYDDEKYGFGKTQYGDLKLQGRTGFPQNDIGNTRQFEDLQLTAAEWEERARKVAEHQYSQFNNFGQGTGIDSNARRLHTIIPAVRDVIFSQNYEDLLHSTKKPSGKNSAFELFGYSGSNNEVTVPRNIPSKAINTGAANYLSNKNKIKGRRRINAINNGSKQAKDIYRGKDRSKDVISNLVASDVLIDSGRKDENIVGNDSVYGRSSNVYVPTKDRRDKEGSNDLNNDFDSKKNSIHVVQSSIGDHTGNVTFGDSYDTKDSSDKADSISNYVFDSSTKSGSRSETNENSGDSYDTAKSSNDKTESVTSHFDFDTKVDLKDMEENTVDNNKTLYDNVDDSYGLSTNKSVESGSVSLNNANDTESQYKNSDSDIPNDEFSLDDDRNNIVKNSDSINQANNSTVMNSSSIAIGSFDESVTEESFSKNGDYSSDFNITSEAKAKNSEDVGRNDNADTNIDENYLKYSTDVNSFNNETLAEVDASTVSYSRVNTDKSDHEHEPVNVESNTSKSDDSDINVTSKDDESRDISIVVNTDSNIDKSNTEYSANLDNTDNRTLYETDTSTITSQIMNTTEFYNSDASKYDHFDIPVTEESSSGNGDSSPGMISRVEDNNSSNINFSYDADSNIHNGTTEYSTSLDEFKNNTITETDLLQVTAKATTDDVSKSDDHNDNQENDIETTNNYTTADSTETSTLPTIVDESIEKSNSAADAFATSTSQTTAKDEFNKEFDDLLESNKTENSTNIDSVIVDLSDSEPESTTIFEVNSQNASDSELSVVTEKSVSETFDKTNQSLSIADNASTLTNNSTDDFGTSTTLIADTNSDSTLRDSNESTSSTTVIDITKAFDKSTDATTAVSFDDSSYSSDTSTTRATLGSSSIVTSAFDSTAIGVTEANSNSTNTTPYDNSGSDTTLASETPDLNAYEVSGSNSDRTLNDTTEISTTSTNIAPTNDSDGNYFNTDKSVTPSSLDSDKYSVDNSALNSSMIDVSNTSIILTDNTNADVIDRDSSDKFVDLLDTPAITTSSPSTASDLTTSSNNATANDSSTDSAITTESNPIIENPEISALASTSDKIVDSLETPVITTSSPVTASDLTTSSNNATANDSSTDSAITTESNPIIENPEISALASTSDKIVDSLETPVITTSSPVTASDLTTSSNNATANDSSTDSIITTESNSNIENPEISTLATTSGKIVDSLDTPAITTSSPVTASDLTTSSNNATANDSSTDSTITTESNPNIENTEMSALATTIKNANDEENSVAVSTTTTEINTPADIKPDISESPVTQATPDSNTDNSGNITMNRLDNAGILYSTNLATADAAAAGVTEDKIHNPTRPNGTVENDYNTDESLNVIKLDDIKEVKNETAESKSDESASRSVSVEPSSFNSSGVNSVSTDESASTSGESNLR